MKAALGILTTAPEFDLVLAAIGSSARSQPETTVRPIIDSAGAARPLAAFLVPDAPQALAMLSRAGVPNFRTPEACADVIAAALSRQPPRPLPARTAATAASGGPILAELAPGAPPDPLGVSRAPPVGLPGGVPPAPPLPLPLSCRG